MTVPALLRQKVEARVASQAQQIFLNSNVGIQRSGALRIEASVLGTQSYAVALERRADEVVYSCTCRYFEDRRSICKHVWATVLEAESELGFDFASWTKTKSGSVAWTAAIAEDSFRSSGKSTLPVSPSWRPRLTAKPAWQGLLARVRALDALQVRMASQGWGRGEVLYTVEALEDEPGLRLRTWSREAGRQGGREGDREEGVKPGRIRALRMLVSDIAELPEASDRRLFGALCAVSGMGRGLRYRHELPASFDLVVAALPAFLDLLGETGRAFWSDRQGSPPEPQTHPFAWLPEPVECRLRLTRTPLIATGEPAQLAIGPSWSRRGVHLASHEEPVGVVKPFLFGPGWVSPIQNPEVLPWVTALAEGGSREPVRLAADGSDGALTALLEQPRLPPLDLPPELGVIFETGTPNPRLELRSSPDPYGGKTRIDATLWFAYGGFETRPSGERSGFYDPSTRHRMSRDRSREGALVSRLRQLGFSPAALSRAYLQADFEVAPQQLAPAVRELLTEGWDVAAEGLRYRVPGPTRLAIRSGVDWFDLEGFVDYDGENVSLPRLLAAHRKGEQFVRLDDGSLGLLPEEWLARQGVVVGLGEVEGERLRFRNAQAALVDAFLGDQPEIDYDERFERSLDALSSLNSTTSKTSTGGQEMAGIGEIPGFHGTLRDYQRQGVAWLGFLAGSGFGGCLADDMGLGKTIQLLAHLARQRFEAAGKRAEKHSGLRPSLVVVPKSTLWNWCEEARRFAPDLPVLVHAGPDRARDPHAFASAVAQGGLVLTTYGTVRSDLSLLASQTFGTCVLDEAQAIKNPNTATAKAVRALHADHRLALTGTPVENHLGELWSLFEFLNPGLLGKSSLWRSTAGNERELDPEARDRLRRALRPFILRRTKREVAPELPSRTEQTIVCELEPQQRKLYDELRDHYRRSLLGRIEKSGLGKSRMHVLEALLRLRQAACHPGLIDPTRSEEDSAKFADLLPRLEELRQEGHKALVFSQFTSLLALLRRRLDRRGFKYQYLDGSTTDRRTPVDRFQNDPEFGLFLVSLKAGGVGLNLTAAGYVFLLDPWWNPAVEAQAIDRAHRIGQTQPVFAYRLIAGNTIEQRILELQKDKRELAEAIFSEDQRGLAGIGVEELRMLLA